MSYVDSYIVGSPNNISSEDNVDSTEVNSLQDSSYVDSINTNSLFLDDESYDDNEYKKNLEEEYKKEELRNSAVVTDSGVVLPPIENSDKEVTEIINSKIEDETTVKRRVEVSLSRKEREKGFNKSALELGISRDEFVDTYVTKNMKQEDTPWLNAWLDYVPNGADILLNVGDGIGWSVGGVVDGIETVLNSSQDNYNIINNIARAATAERATITQYRSSEGITAKDLANKVAANLGVALEFLETTPAFIPLKATTVATRAYSNAARTTKQAENILKNPKKLSALEDEMFKAAGVFETLSKTKDFKSLTTVDEVLEAQNIVANRKLELKYAPLGLGTEKQLMASRLAEAKKIADDNPEILDDLINNFETNDAGEKIIDISKVVDGYRVIDMDKVKLEGKKILARQEESINTGGFNADESSKLSLSSAFVDHRKRVENVDLLDELDVFTLPILNPDKMTSLVAVIADLKKYNPTAWNPKKNTLDNLFDMLIDDKIGKAIAEGGEEAVKVQDIITKYGLTLDDYILAVIGSGSRLGRGLNKFKQLAEHNIRKTTKGRKDTKIDKENDEWWASWVQGLKRLEGARRGGLVSNIGTAGRNALSMGVRMPLEGFVNVFEDSIRILGTEGLSAATKAYVPFNKNARQNWSNSFAHMKFIFNRPDMARAFTDAILKRPDGIKDYNRLFNNLNGIQESMGRGKGGKVDKGISVYEDLIMTLNYANTFQEHLMRRGLFIGEMQRNFKRYYDKDMFDEFRAGRMQDWFDDSPYLTKDLPKGTPNVKLLVDMAVNKAKKTTFGSSPELPIFRNISRFMVNTGMTLIHPFPNFMFSLVELIGQSSFGGLIPATQGLMNKTFLKYKWSNPVKDVKTGKRTYDKFDVYSDKNRERIANNIVGVAALNAFIVYRTKVFGLAEDMPVPQDPDQINIPYLKKAFGVGVLDTELIKLHIGPMMEVADYVAHGFQGGIAYANSVFSIEKLVESIINTTARGSFGSESLFQEVIEVAKKEDLTKGQKFSKKTAEFLGNIIMSLGAPANQYIEAQRVLGYRPDEYRETGTDITGISKSETFNNSFNKKFKRFAAPSDEWEMELKRKIGMRETGTSRGNALLKMFGLTLIEEETFVEDYLKEIGIKPWSLPKEPSNLASVKNIVIDTINSVLPLVIMEAKLLEDEYRYMYSQKSDFYKDKYSEEAYAYPLVEKFILGEVANIKAELNSKRYGSDVAEKYSNTKSLYITAAKYKKQLKPQDRIIAYREFVDLNGRRPDVTSVEDLKALILIGKEYEDIYK